VIVMNAATSSTHSSPQEIKTASWAELQGFFRPMGGGGRLHLSLRHYAPLHQSELSKGTECRQLFHTCQS
jgi:hypothetical protein